MDFNLEDYYVSKIRIKKGKSYTKDDYYCRWYDVSLNIKNKYFTYNETRECLLESELWEIYNNIDKCLNNKMNENKNLSFIEPDLEIELSKSNDENHIHLCDFKVFINLEGVAGCDYYSFTLDDEDMIRFKDYIKNVLENKNHSDEEQYKTYNYVSVVYDDDIVAKTINEPSFYYKTDKDDISVGDKVLVDRTGKQVVGIVIDIEEFEEDEVPFPVDKTKDIIKILEKNDGAIIKNNIICPNCGSKMVDIVYGMPPADIGEKAKKGELFLGGCMISDNDPSYHCNNCKRSYFKNLKDYIEEPNNFE